MEEVKLFWTLLPIFTLIMVGWRLVTDDGQLLGSLRSWAKGRDIKVYYGDTIEVEADTEYEWHPIRHQWYKIQHHQPLQNWVLKPIILCVTCYSSFWAILLYIGAAIWFKDIHYFFIVQGALCFCSAVTNTLLWFLLCIIAQNIKD